MEYIDEINNHFPPDEYEADLHIVFVNKNDPHRLFKTIFLIQGYPNIEPNEFLENVKQNNLKEGDHTREVKLDDLYNKFEERLHKSTMDSWMFNHALKMSSGL